MRPIFINKAFKTLLRGQALRGGRCKTSSGAASPGSLTRGGEIKARQTSRGPRDVSHDDRDQAGASARSVLASSLVPRGNRGRGVPRHQAKVSILVQQYQDQQDGKTEVTMEPRTTSPSEPFAGEDHFCQDKLYYLSPFKLAVVGSLPAQYLGRGPGPI